jgi:hypothetical protein
MKNLKNFMLTLKEIWYLQAKNTWALHPRGKEKFM